MATRLDVVALAAGLVLAGCAGTPAATVRPTIATPEPELIGAPVTDEPPASEIPMRSPEATPAGEFMLTSSAFVEGGAIPRTYACDGQDTSPPLEWSGAPGGTKTLALVMTDPDAGGFVHWVFFNVDATASGGIPTGFSASPDGPPQGRNSFAKAGYGGPCPPSGTHHYVFRLLALDSSLELTGAPSAGQMLAAADGHILAEAKLTATYRKGG